MSHFSVMVVGDNLEEQFEPYSEHLEVPRIKIKLEHIREKKEFLVDLQNGDNSYTEYLKDPKSYIEKNKDSKTHIEWLIKTVPSLLKASDEELYQESVKYCEPEQINEDGSTNEIYNPLSKWDWYEVGGRWSDMLLLKNGKRVNKAKISDIDFETMEKQTIKNRKESWEEYSKDKDKNNGEDSPMFYFRYGITPGSTKEDFIYKNTSFSTFAVLKEGQWFEKGEMGWWGVSNNEKPNWSNDFNNIFNGLEDDTEITIVDCHI